jgi:hypothetical protein
MNLDPALERTLRAVLEQDRPQNGAPADLRAVVLGLPDHQREPFWLRLIRGPSLAVAALGVAATAVALAAAGFARLSITTVAPAAPGTTSPGFDPTVMGQGLVTQFVPLAQALGLIVVIVAGSAAVLTFLSPNSATNRGRITIIAGLVGVAIGLALMRLDVGLTRGGVAGNAIGYTTSANPQFGSEFVLISVAEPGEPVVGVVSIRNTSALPVRLEGLMAYGAFDPNADGNQWTGLWLNSDPNSHGVPGPDVLVPFRPITLEPDHEVNVYLAGRAGRCAYGPDYDPDSPPTQPMVFSQAGPEFTFVYSVFGLTAQAVVDSGEIFVFPARDGCA